LESKNGLPQTTYMTREQLALLAIKPDPKMDAVRANNAADQARAVPIRPRAQTIRRLKPAPEKPRPTQDVNSRDNNDFLTKALIFGTGIAVGGALHKP